MTRMIRLNSTTTNKYHATKEATTVLYQKDQTCYKYDNQTKCEERMYTYKIIDNKISNKQHRCNTYIFVLISIFVSL